MTVNFEEKVIKLTIFKNAFVGWHLANTGCHISFVYLLTTFRCISKLKVSSNVINVVESTENDVVVAYLKTTEFTWGY